VVSASVTFAASSSICLLSSRSLSWEDVISFCNSSTLTSLSASFAFNSSTSFDDAAAEAEGRVVGVFEAGDPEIADNRFFTSGTAPATVDLAEATDLPGKELEEVGARTVLELVGFTSTLGLAELDEIVGFRTDGATAVPRFSAIDSGFADVPDEGARDVLLAPVDNGFFFSSPDPPIDVDVRCPALADVEAVALEGVFRTVDTGGRVGGLLSPPVVLAEDASGVLLAVVEDPIGRLAATPGRLGSTFSFFTPLDAFAGDSFSVSVSTSEAEASAAVSSPDKISAGVSSWGTTSFAETSAILRIWSCNRCVGGSLVESC